MKTNVTNPGALVAIVLVLALAPTTVLAQTGLMLSNSADFAADLRSFSLEDDLYLRVQDESIDHTDLAKNRFVIESADGAIDGSFENHFDGTYTARVSLAELFSNEGVAEIEVELEDDAGNAFRAETEISVGFETMPPDLMIVGEVLEKGDDFLVLYDRKITVSSETEFATSDGDLITFADIFVGDEVEVHFVTSDDGSFLAIRITLLHSDDDRDEVKIVGPIERLGEMELVVFGHLVVVTDDTEMVGEGGLAIRFGDLAVGDIVEVEGWLAASGAIHARSIEVEDDMLEFEFRGFIEEVTDSGIVVFGRHISVNSETRITTEDGVELSLSDMHAGMFVEVLAVLTTDGSIVALRIDVKGDGVVELTGPITDIGDEAFVVLGVKFLVNASTEIEDENGHEIRFADLKEGYVVYVRAERLDDETLLATDITVKSVVFDRVEITGHIEEIGDVAIVVDGHKIFVTEETEIFDPWGEQIRFGELRIGMTVKVRALVLIRSNDAISLTDRLIVATRIEVLARRDRIVGKIHEIGDNVLVVGDIRITFDSETEIFAVNGDEIRPIDLEVGQHVAVWVVKLDSGDLYAKEIRVLVRIEDEVGVVGVLESVDDDGVVVLGQHFHVTSRTSIRNRSGEPIRLGDLEIGHPIIIRGELLAGGSMVALWIQELDHRIEDIKVYGPVESVEANTLAVIGIHFFTNAETRIVDLAGNEIVLGDLEIGQTVRVHAEGQPDGTRLATLIQLQEVFVASGELAVDNVSGTITLMGATYTVDADILVVTESGVTSGQFQLKSGMLVEIRGVRESEGAQGSVSKVNVLDSNGIALGNEDPEESIPTSIVLEQNYPNPFNPTTTITFEISDANGAALPTRLDIYNVLGQHIVTLVDASLPAGTHQYQWNGTDASGNVVTNGVYLYQVRTARQSVSRSMVLMK